jgi:nucleotide-binding universal stress UspA family protein
VERTLIVPLIGSVESVHALQTARAAARTSGGRLVLLRAVPHRHPHASRADEEKVRRETDLLAHELGKDGITAEVQVRRAEPKVAIIDTVREYDASAIVRPSHKGHDLAGWLRGMIVDEVMHQIQIPVLIIPAVEEPACAPGSRLRVLVPLDGSAGAESALVHLLDFARHRPLEIRLIAVAQLRLGPLGALLPCVPDSQTERCSTTRYLHDLAATLRAEGLVAHTDVIESQESIGRVLLDLVRRSVVDVVVMATHGLNTPGHLPQGSDTTELHESCPVPVLLVPNSAAMEPTGRAREGGRVGAAEAVRHESLLRSAERHPSLWRAV